MTARRTLFALLLGGIGGGGFAALGLPLPWMLGSMSLCGLISLSSWRPVGISPFVPRPLRSVMLAVLAVMLGSSFTPALWSQMHRWSGTLAVLFLAMLFSVLIGMAYLRRVGRFDRVTAYFASAPGGINEMVVTGGALGGDERSIALIHSLRIILIVFTIPFGFRLMAGIPSPSLLDSMGRINQMQPMDALVLLAIAVGGSLLGRWLRFPAATLTGPLLVSAATHVTGLTSSHLPGELVIIAQIVTGAGLGARFVGTSWAELAATVRLSLGSTGLLLLISGGAAALAAGLCGVPFGLLLLSFVPGGIAEMCLIALSLGQDVAFVSTHHVLRVIMVIVAAPAIFRLTKALWISSE